MIIKHSLLEINALKADGAKNTSDQFESKKNEPKTRTCIKKIIFILINDKAT
jgi:hypothetical protein